MPLTESTVVGRDVEIVQEKASGLRTQKANTTTGDAAYAAHGEQQSGVLQCLVIRTHAAADAAYDAAGAIANFYGTTKGVRNEKYRIVKIDTVIRVKRTGGTRASASKVQKGDGAASEAFSDVVASVVDTANVVDTPMSQILVAAQTLLSSGETLRVQHEVSGSTTTGTEQFECYVYLLPVRA